MTWNNLPLPTFITEPAEAEKFQEHSDALTAMIGAQDTWSPTYTNLTLGTTGAATVARYWRSGKKFSFFWMATLGTGFTMPGGVISFSLPSGITPHSSYITLTQIGTGQLFDTGTANYGAIGRYNGTGVDVLYLGASGIHTVVAATAPFTFIAGDRLFVAGKDIELA